MVGIHEEQANVSGTMIKFMLIYVKKTYIYILVDWSYILFCAQIVANTLKSDPSSVTQVSGNYYGFPIQNRKNNN